MYKKTRFYPPPPLNEVQGVYRINLFVRPFICLSVRLSVCPSSVYEDSCPARNIFALTFIRLTIFGIWVCSHETMTRKHS